MLWPLPGEGSLWWSSVHGVDDEAFGHDED